MTAPTAAVRDLALALPSRDLPAYLYDLDALGAHAARVRAALPERVELYYAAKANPEPRLLATLSPHCDGFEVASGGELAHVAAAVPGRPRAFGGPGKTPDEIRSALRAGIHRIHAESLHELRVLARLTDGPGTGRPLGVLLRFNLPLDPETARGSALAMGGTPSPFGIDPADADEAVRLVTGAPGLALRGVHAHLASGLDAPALLSVARSVVGRAEELTARHRLPLHEVNIGGGMGVDYARPGDRFDWTAYGHGLGALLASRPGLRLRVEPGRALTAYCGWYATEVLDVKRSRDEDFAVVRGGTHHLRTPAAKGHDQPCTVLPVGTWTEPWPRPAARSGRVTLTGQLCTPKDVLARGVPAPGLRAGDRILFGLAGAYAWNISHHDFLMHPRPGFHFLGTDGGPAPGPTVPGAGT
ncbi:type III PLP-dependent enzyme [Streptomyces zhihengii]|uniref:type III PLP-dependent enzyme n=1 Tax=Streptomyces zhihengii TaxID=1818004 RepID=UPI003644083D